MTISYIPLRAKIMKVTNSKGLEFAVGDRALLYDTGEIVTITEILMPKGTEAGCGEFRIRFKDTNNRILGSFNIEFASQYLEVK